MFFSKVTTCCHMTILAYRIYSKLWKNNCVYVCFGIYGTAARLSIDNHSFILANNEHGANLFISEHSSNIDLLND